MYINPRILSAICLFPLAISIHAAAAPAAGSGASGGPVAFSALPRGESLKAGKSLAVPDVPALRLRPGLDLGCRFRLNEL
jgi:hypothetical protein